MYHVERGAESGLSTFVTIYTSEAAKGVAWNDGARVTVSIDPLPDKGIPPVERTFKAVFSNEGIEMIALFGREDYGASVEGTPVGDAVAALESAVYMRLDQYNSAGKDQLTVLRSYGVFRFVGVYSGH